MDTDKKSKDFGMNFKLITGMLMMFLVGYLAGIIFTSEKVPLLWKFTIGLILLMASVCAFMVMRNDENE